MSVEELLEEVLRLPAADRRRIASELGASLADEDIAVSAEEWNSAWSTEIKRRIREVEEGAVTPIPWRESLERIRSEFQRKDES
jgi:putative addiction module component (TIGR02574 family)